MRSPILPLYGQAVHETSFVCARVQDMSILDLLHGCRAGGRRSFREGAQMNRIFSAILVPSAYFGICVIAIAFAEYGAGQSPLSAIYIVSLTLPWSAIETFLVLLLNLKIHHGIQLLLTTSFVFLNTVLLWLLGRRRLQRGGGQK